MPAPTEVPSPTEEVPFPFPKEAPLPSPTVMRTPPEDEEVPVPTEVASPTEIPSPTEEVPFPFPKEVPLPSPSVMRTPPEDEEVPVPTEVPSPTEIPSPTEEVPFPFPKEVPLPSLTVMRTPPEDEEVPVPTEVPSPTEIPSPTEEVPCNLPTLILKPSSTPEEVPSPTEEVPPPTEEVTSPTEIYESPVVELDLEAAESVQSSAHGKPVEDACNWMQERGRSDTESEVVQKPKPKKGACCEDEIKKDEKLPKGSTHINASATRSKDMAGPGGWTVVTAIKAHRLRSYYEIPDEGGLREYAVGVALEENLLDSFSQQLARPFPELVKTGKGRGPERGIPRLLVKTAIEVGAIGAFSEIPAALRGDKEILKAALEKQIEVKIGADATAPRGLQIGAAQLTSRPRPTDRDTAIDILSEEQAAKLPRHINKDSFAMATVLKKVFPFGTGARLEGRIAEIGMLLDVERVLRTNVRGDKGSLEKLAKFYPASVWKGKAHLALREEKQELHLTRKDFRLLLAAAARVGDFADRQHRRVRLTQKNTPRVSASVDQDGKAAAQRVAEFLPKVVAYLLESAALNEEQTSVTLTLPTFHLEALRRVLLLLRDEEVFDLVSPDMIIPSFSADLYFPKNLQNDKEIVLLALRAGIVQKLDEIPEKLQQDVDVVTAALLIDAERRKMAKTEMLEAGIAKVDAKKLTAGLQSVWEELGMPKRRVVRVRETGKISETQLGLSRAEAESLVETPLAFDSIVSAKNLASLVEAKFLNFRNKNKIVPLAVKAGVLPRGEWKQQRAFLKQVLLLGSESE
eukprot:g13049.t1